MEIRDLETSDIQSYLELIQSTITRMSSTSSIIKGFAATVITGITALSLTDINKWVLLLSFAPILSFGALDVYYLKLEKKYRYLYNQVRLSQRPCDYAIDVVWRNRTEKRLASATVGQCLISPSIWLFYVPVLLLSIVICFIKFARIA